MSPPLSRMPSTSRAAIGPSLARARPTPTHRRRTGLLAFPPGGATTELAPAPGTVVDRDTCKTQQQRSWVPRHPAWPPPAARRPPVGGGACTGARPRGGNNTNPGTTCHPYDRGVAPAAWPAGAANQRDVLGRTRRRTRTRPRARALAHWERTMQQQQAPPRRSCHVEPGAEVMRRLQCSGPAAALEICRLGWARACRSS